MNPSAKADSFRIADIRFCAEKSRWPGADFSAVPRGGRVRIFRRHYFPSYETIGEGGFIPPQPISASAPKNRGGRVRIFRRHYFPQSRG
jgi:hypothetical protein